jgi:hypothetical protein
MEEPVTSTPDKKESRGIPKIEVKVPSPKKRSEPLPWGGTFHLWHPSQPDWLHHLI